SRQSRVPARKSQPLQTPGCGAENGTCSGCSRATYGSDAPDLKWLRPRPGTPGTPIPTWREALETAAFGAPTPSTRVASLIPGLAAIARQWLSSKTTRDQPPYTRGRDQCGSSELGRGIHF